MAEISSSLCVSPGFRLNRRFGCVCVCVAWVVQKGHSDASVGEQEQKCGGRYEVSRGRKSSVSRGQVTVCYFVVEKLIGENVGVCKTPSSGTCPKVCLIKGHLSTTSKTNVVVQKHSSCHKSEVHLK